MRTCIFCSCVLVLPECAYLQKWMDEKKANPDSITYADCEEFEDLEQILITDLINKGVDPGECCTCVLVVLTRAYSCVTREYLWF